MIAVADLRRYLSGSWTVRRLVADRRAQACGRFAGTAAFMASDGGLRYVEEGLLRLGGVRYPASRAYRFAFPTPGFAEVRFDDGRPFHDLDLCDGTWSAEHHCGDDRYRGTFAAEGADTWISVWEVVGPRKALRLATRYRRARDGLSVVIPNG